MGVNATDEAANSLASQPLYLTVLAGQGAEGWRVMPTYEAPNPLTLGVLYSTQAAAQKECDRLNELWANWQEGDAGRRDAVLGRMMKVGK